MNQTLRRLSVLMLPLAAFVLASCMTPEQARREAVSVSKIAPGNAVFDLEDEGLKLKWQANLGQISGRELTALHPTEGCVVVEASGGEMHVYGAQWGRYRSGTVLRSPLAQPPAQLGDTLFLIVVDRLVSYDIETRSVTTGYDPGFLVFTQPAVHGTALLLGGANGHLMKMPLTAKVGEVIYSLSGPIVHPPVIADETVYAAGRNAEAAAIALEDGELEWAWKPLAPSMLTSGIELLGRHVCVGDNRGFFYCLDADSGDLVNRTMLDGPVVDKPLLADDHVLALTSTPSLFCLDAGAETEIVWKYTGATRVLTVGPSAVYVLTDQDTLAAVSLETGEEMWALPVSDDWMFAGAKATTTFYVADPEGNIAAFSELE